ncbi:MAG TPA: GntR family transcriptional regulator [Verrucomicrobiales bacterium]|nr:GntR family transcriptional regulator [Verrucomicrobiales bacterium]HIL68315.1 GntR family transcriptional regulator [Verrucomicrobiota bacterium]
MLPFTIDIEDGIPVSDQIIQAVRKSILTGQLTAGEPFPSVRTMSQELRISPTTAHKVVASLKQEGLLASRPGIGMVISTAPLPSRDERLTHLIPSIRSLLKEAEELNLEPGDVIKAVRSEMNSNEQSKTKRK